MQIIVSVGLVIALPAILVQNQPLLIVIIVGVELGISHCVLLSVEVWSPSNVSYTDPRVVG